MGKEMEIYPVTIIEDRYTGTYSGALWTAFNLYDDEIPSAVSGDDVSCREFWDFVKKFNVIVGYGSTPDEAFKDLARKSGCEMER